jgi:aconitate hydratase
LLGARAVLAVSFERIHRSNLIGMGVLPLRLPKGIDPKKLALAPGDRIEIEAPPADLAPRMVVPVTIRRASGATEVFEAVAAIETSLEVDLLRTGGIIPFILQRTIARSPGLRNGSLENQV